MKRVLLAASIFVFYVLLRSCLPLTWLPLTNVVENMPPPHFYSHLAIVFLIIVGLLSRLPSQDGLLAIIALVPFEFTVSIPPLPVLSPTAYLCAAILSAEILKRGPIKLVSHIVDSIPKPALILWSFFLLYGLGDAIFLKGSTRSLVRWGEFLFIFSYAAFIPASERLRSTARLAKLLCLSGGAVSLLALYQFYSSHGNFMQTYATFGHNNGLSAYLSLCLPAILRLTMLEKSAFRRISRICLPLASMAFAAAFSRGAWLGLGAGGLIILWQYREKNVSFLSASAKKVLLASLVAVSAIFILNNRSFQNKTWHTNGRHDYWRLAGRILSRHPLVGLGPGNYAKYYLLYLTPKQLKDYLGLGNSTHHTIFWLSLHSIYLQMAVDYGCIGFLLWLMALRYLFAPSYRRSFEFSNPWQPYLLVSITAFFIHNMVDILFVNSFDLVIAAFAALSQVSSQEDRTLR